MKNSKKQIQKTSSSDFEQSYLNDIKYKGYAESLRSGIEIILSNHDNKSGVLTKAEGIKILKNSVLLANQMYDAFHNICEDKYRLVNEVEALNERMRNMESMVFTKDND